MTPHYADEWLTLYGGDARTVLETLPSDSVDCIVTSPPYWGLRDYGTATWIGGDEACDHIQRTNKHGGTSNRPGLEAQTYEYPNICGKCGSTRQDSQLGLEATPEEYVANLVAVFGELRRVLKPSGACWLNLGDSYAAGKQGQGSFGDPSSGLNNGLSGRDSKTGERMATIQRKPPPGLKPKDLVGIPWRVAFALQADGWWLRSDVIWAKPNPMPESVTDRPTKAHEYLFLLTKSARYYFDADAVRERGATGAWEAMPPIGGVKQTNGNANAYSGNQPASDGNRNLRSVWTIATRPYPGAHFAVFPPELPERCIKAGCPEGGVTLDPFAGSGTVGLVANRLSRRAILIDLNPEYLEQQMKRNAQIPVGL